MRPMVSLSISLRLCLFFGSLGPLMAQAAPLNQNLMTCQPSSNQTWVGHCAVDQSQILGYQSIESTVTVAYNFACGPGQSTWLQIGVQDDNGPVTTFLFGRSGVITLTGQGPFNIRDGDSHKTGAISLLKGCSLVVTSVTAIPLPAAVDARLSSDEKAAEGWTETITVTSTNHAAFVKAQAGSYCTLVNDFNHLSDVLGANGDLSAITSSGGLPAQKLLSEATQSASDNGAFDLGGSDPFAYLQTNLATILQHAPDCAAFTADDLVPNIDRCRGVGLCKSNVEAYQTAAKNLENILEDARSLRSESSAPASQQWIDVDALSIK